MSLGDGVDRGGERCSITDIARDHFACSTLGRDLRFERGEMLRIARDPDNMPPVLGEPKRDGAPDSPTGSSNDGYSLIDDSLPF